MKTNSSRAQHPHRRTTHLRHFPKTKARLSVIFWSLPLLIGSWFLPGVLSASSHYVALRAALECRVVDATDPGLAKQIAILAIHESKQWTKPILKQVGADFFVFDGTNDGEIAASNLVFDDSRFDNPIGEYPGHYRTSELPPPFTFRFHFRIDRTTLRATRLMEGGHRIDYACEVVDPSRYLRALEIYSQERERIIEERRRKREAELRERKI